MSVLDDLSDDELARAPEAPLPGRVSPMLATLTEDYLADPGWLYERKLDGVRATGIRSADGARLRSRNGNDLHAPFPEVVDALAAGQPGAVDLVVDGEVVAFDGAVTSFARLQARTNLTDARRARATGVAIFSYVFDVLHAGGRDLTRLPLRRRKALLRRLLAWEDPLRFTPHRTTDGEAYRQEACRKGWEGVIAKRADGPYRHGRSTDWLKLKCAVGQELVIGGWTDPEGARHDLGALLVGYHDGPGGPLVYAGKVGTGYDEATLADLGSRLRSRERETTPFDRGEVPHRGVHWATPDLVCEVGFTEWTRAGRLRHPRYLGLRHDKDPAAVVREEPRSLEG